MKIPNPFPGAEHVRFRCKPGDGGGVVGKGGEIDAPDGTEEVLIESVDIGRSDAKVVFAARIWSKRWGMNGADDHLQKMRLEEDKAALAAEREKDAKRKAKEARERASKAPKAFDERVAPVITERMEDVSSGIEKGVIDPKADMGKELEL